VRARFERASAAWSAFFYAECDGRVLALLRIGFALLVLLHWVAMRPLLEMLWLDRGMLPLAELPAVADGFVPTLFGLLPANDSVVYVGYHLLGLHACLLLIGYRSRLQIIGVLLWLISFQSRNPLVVNGQDAVLRLIGVLLALAPLGACWSIDRYLGRVKDSRIPYVPLRFLQVQIALVMLSAGIWKLRGDDWTGGTALYYVTRLEGFWGNLPLPSALSSAPLVLRIATFATLALELTVPVLIWLPRTRRAALGLALLFHAGLAYAMNLFLFAPIMMLGWCSFLQREDLDALARRVARPVKVTRGQVMKVEGELI